VRGRTQVLATEQPHGSGQGVLRTYHLSNGWQVTAAKSLYRYIAEVAEYSWAPEVSGRA
jgi:hypothetical protein